MRITKADTLGALALATSFIIDSAAQTSSTPDSLSGRKSQYVTSAPVKMEYQPLFESPSKDNQKAAADDGTFSSRKLFWSGENNQVYFKGRSRVDFGDNHFDSDGEVNFLGTVYLLTINGKAIAPGSIVELEKRQYRLTMLSGSEAMSKYGKQGEKGAVEIF